MYYHYLKLDLEIQEDQEDPGTEEFLLIFSSFHQLNFFGSFLFSLLLNPIALLSLPNGLLRGNKRFQTQFLFIINSENEIHKDQKSIQVFDFIFITTFTKE